MSTVTRPLFIWGYGSHHAEVAEIADRYNLTVPTWDFIAFAVSEKAREKYGDIESLSGFPVMDQNEALKKHPNADFLPFRRPDPLLPMDQVVSLVDPSSFVSKTAKLGRGCVIYPNCFIGHKVVLGDFVVCLASVTINHDCVVEDRVFFGSGANLAGTVKVGSGSFMGQGSTVRQVMTVGENVMAGTGAVIVKDVPANKVVIGNPARILRDR